MKQRCRQGKNCVLVFTKIFKQGLDTYAVDQFAEIGGINANVVCQVFVWDQLQNMRTALKQFFESFFGRIAL
jgi:hypothetical protein